MVLSKLRGILVNIVIVNLLCGLVLGQCSNPQPRKEIRELSRIELNNYLNAVNTIHFNKTLDRSGLNPLDRLTKLHSDNFPQIHGHAYFLPWHRKFLLEYEKLLQTVNPTVKLPYWDWTLDARYPDRSIVLSEIYYGGNGDSTSDYCLESGAFANWIVKNPNSHCLPRDYDEGDTIASFTSAEDVNAVLNEGRFSDFSYVFELYHGDPHTGIGGDNGDFSGQYSANDPLFFLHHNFIDVVWSEYQKRHPTTPFDAVRYRESTNANSQIPTYNIPISSVLDTTKNGFCFTDYRYPRALNIPPDSPAYVKVDEPSSSPSPPKSDPVTPTPPTPPKSDPTTPPPPPPVVDPPKSDPTTPPPPPPVVDPPKSDPTTPSPPPPVVDPPKSDPTTPSPPPPVVDPPKSDPTTPPPPPPVVDPPKSEPVPPTPPVYSPKSEPTTPKPQSTPASTPPRKPNLKPIFSHLNKDGRFELNLSKITFGQPIARKRGRSKGSNNNLQDALRKLFKRTDANNRDDKQKNAAIYRKKSNKPVGTRTGQKHKRRARQYRRLTDRKSRKINSNISSLTYSQVIEKYMDSHQSGDKVVLPKDADPKIAVENYVKNDNKELNVPFLKPISQDWIKRNGFDPAEVRKAETTRQLYHAILNSDPDFKPFDGDPDNDFDTETY